MSKLITREHSVVKNRSPPKILEDRNYKTSIWYYVDTQINKKNEDETTVFQENLPHDYLKK